MHGDAANRTSVIESGSTSYSANNLNQYEYVGSVYYDYDLNGNTTFDGVAYYSYDSENRLIGAVNAEGSTAGPLNAAVENMELSFTRGGDANWAPIRPDAYDPNIGGPDSAKSGVISTSQSTYSRLRGNDNLRGRRRGHGYGQVLLQERRQIVCQ